MDEDGYRGGPTPEGLWGCLVAALIGIPIFLFLMLVTSLGDCGGGSECKKGTLTHVEMPSIAISVGVFLLVRWAIKAARKNGR